MSAVLEQATLRYAVECSRDGWELQDETLPESVIHDEAVGLLKAILAAWVARRGLPAIVVRNLAVRWVQDRPQVGVDPDVCVLSPPPPDRDLQSVRTWVDGHTAPILAIEVVRNADPRKDYVIAPEKYAASGTLELWVFDPRLCGPTSHGGPYLLQVWRRDDDLTFTRVHAGNGPVYSPTLGGHAVVVDDGRALRIATDAAGTDLWPTAEEAERAAKDAALARLAELELELRRRDG